jgi:hypothetical protein
MIARKHIKVEADTFPQQSSIFKYKGEHIIFDMDVKQLVQQAFIPVYGIKGIMFDLHLTNIGKSSHREDKTDTQILANITLGFSGERAGLATTFELHSYNNQNNELRRQTLKILEPHPYPLMNMDNKTLRHLGIKESTQQSFGQPVEVNEQIIVAEQTFIITLHYWNLTSLPAWFLLRNDNALISGQAKGLTKDELFYLLEQCVVVNNQEQLLHQYQQELEHYLALSGWERKGGDEPATRPD